MLGCVVLLEATAHVWVLPRDAKRLCSKLGCTGLTLTRSELVLTRTSVTDDSDAKIALALSAAHHRATPAPCVSVPCARIVEQSQLRLRPHTVVDCAPSPFTTRADDTTPPVGAKRKGAASSNHEPCGRHLMWCPVREPEEPYRYDHEADETEGKTRVKSQRHFGGLPWVVHKSAQVTKLTHTLPVCGARTVVHGAQALSRCYYRERVGQTVAWVGEDPETGTLFTQHIDGLFERSVRSASLGFAACWPALGLFCHDKRSNVMRTWTAAGMLEARLRDSTVRDLACAPGALVLGTAYPASFLALDWQQHLHAAQLGEYICFVRSRCERVLSCFHLPTKTWCHVAWRRARPSSARAAPAARVGHLVPCRQEVVGGDERDHLADDSVAPGVIHHMSAPRGRVLAACTDERNHRIIVLSTQETRPTDDTLFLSTFTLRETDCEADSKEPPPPTTTPPVGTASVEWQSFSSSKKTLVMAGRLESVQMQVIGRFLVVGPLLSSRRSGGGQELWTMHATALDETDDWHATFRPLPAFYHKHVFTGPWRQDWFVCARDRSRVDAGEQGRPTLLGVSTATKFGSNREKRHPCIEEFDLERWWTTRDADAKWTVHDGAIVLPALAAAHHVSD